MPNIQKAIELLSKAIELGSEEAQFQLALIYDNGLGVKEDHDKAYELYKKAADKGHGGALNNIAYLMSKKNTYLKIRIKKHLFNSYRKLQLKGLLHHSTLWHVNIFLVKM